MSEKIFKVGDSVRWRVAPKRVGIIISEDKAGQLTVRFPPVPGKHKHEVTLSFYPHELIYAGNGEEEER